MVREKVSSKLQLHKKILVGGLVETSRFVNYSVFLAVGVQSLTFTPYLFIFRGGCMAGKDLIKARRILDEDLSN